MKTDNPTFPMGNAPIIETFTNSDFGQVRAVEIDGEAWLVGKDVATILGYSVPRKAIIDHVDIEDKRGFQIGTPSGKQHMIVINESGLYSLVMSSRLPGARKFKRWVTSEVLPAIRRYGAYTTSVPHSMAEALRLAADQAERIEQQQRLITCQQQQVQDLQQTVTEMKPKADYCDLILSSTSAVTITQIAADYNMSAKAMNQLLHDLGIQWKVNDQWVLFTKYMNQGYTRSSTFDFTKSDGQHRTKISTLWTQRGRLFLYNKLKAAGYLPLMEQR